MQALTSACQETSLLGVFDGQRNELMYVATVESRHPLRYFVPLYEWLPVYAGAAGLSILAFLGVEQRDRILSGPRIQLTDATIMDRLGLERHLEQIRRRGYAITRGQRIPGAVGVAAPIIGPEGSVLGAVAITIPEQRFVKGLEAQIVKLVVHAAHDIAAKLGSPARAS
jgi:DNA-binding IclR family transcriptional regulator